MTATDTPLGSATWSTGMHSDHLDNSTDPVQMYNRTTRPGGLSTPSIIFSTFMAFICVVGLVGNGLVIFVVSRYTKMKTVTNMYILNLSVADFFFLLGLPLVIGVSLQGEWVFGAAMCRIYYIQTCINWFTGTFTLVMMSADRYMAVCYPITSMKYRTPIYALGAIALIWIVSVFAMLPIVLFAGLMEKRPGSNSYSCNIDWPSEDPIMKYRIFILYDFFTSFVIPVLLICVFYTLLIFRLKSTGSQIRNANQRRSHRKVTKLVTLIIVVFIVCWLPSWSFQVYNVFRTPGQLRKWTLVLNIIFSIMSYANSMINPVLYAFTNENFRESFISAFRCAADPIRGIRGGRRWSEFVSGNNNSAAPVNNTGLRLPAKANGEQGPDYEFTMLTSNSNSPAGNSSKQEVDASVQVEEEQKLTPNDIDSTEETKDTISGGVYTGPNSVDHS